MRGWKFLIFLHSFRRGTGTNEEFFERRLLIAHEVHYFMSNFIFEKYEKLVVYSPHEVT
jgi:hypothetical protein